MPTRTDAGPSGSTELRFYFDYISSNAHLAWSQLPRLASRYDIERFLAGNDPLDPAELQLWMRPVHPSSVRRRFRPANPGG